MMPLDEHIGWAILDGSVVCDIPFDCACIFDSRLMIGNRTMGVVDDRGLSGGGNRKKDNFPRIFSWAQNQTFKLKSFCRENCLYPQDCDWNTTSFPSNVWQLSFPGVDLETRISRHDPHDWSGRSATKSFHFQKNNLNSCNIPTLKRWQRRARHRT